MKKFLLALIAAFVLLLNNPVSSQTCAKAVIDSPNDAILPYDITCNAKVIVRGIRHVLVHAI